MHSSQVSGLFNRPNYLICIGRESLTRAVGLVTNAGFNAQRSRLYKSGQITCRGNRNHRVRSRRPGGVRAVEQFPGIQVIIEKFNCLNDVAASKHRSLQSKLERGGSRGWTGALDFKFGARLKIGSSSPECQVQIVTISQLGKPAGNVIAACDSKGIQRLRRRRELGEAVFGSFKVRCRSPSPKKSATRVPIGEVVCCCVCQAVSCQTCQNLRANSLGIRAV